MTQRKYASRMNTPKRHYIYECAICSCYHPVNWNGDCRDDVNRYGSPEDYAERNRTSAVYVHVVDMPSEGYAATF